MKVLLFAELQEKAGQSELTIEEQDITVSQLKEKLIGLYPDFPALTKMMVAINEEFANEEDVIRENDVVAIIPPVSGG
ncbi:molybdopterin converting factor subunit 1 [Bacillus alkalicellulosilyticus]|uniref:molybdopterin converting factor subunit 1 n=1 Tax=Alkalihalobacterium alkalicellulosilyticum TaxID=1912214 RepID=UPI000996FA4A|nr:molybdopterin converting factor subunit 1 [Bacillus alkalicellulosilyticus]